MTVIAYLATPIDIRYVRQLLDGLADGQVAVNDDGVLVIEVPEGTGDYAPHVDPCDCSDCRAATRRAVLLESEADAPTRLEGKP
jgi:hypothetical protein